MASLEEMKRILAPLGFYDLTEDSIVSKELTVYALEIDKIRNRFAGILREAMIPTAEGKGLAQREKLFGSPHEDLTVQERRDRLIYRLSLMQEDFTNEGIMRALFSLGYNGTVTEDLENETLILEKINGSEDPADYLAVVEGARELLPAHLRFSFNIEAPTWNQLDEQNKSFNERDKASVPWDFYRDA